MVKWFYKGPHCFEIIGMLPFLLTNLRMKKVSIPSNRKKENRVLFRGLQMSTDKYTIFKVADLLIFSGESSLRGEY